MSFVIAFALRWPFVRFVRVHPIVYGSEAADSGEVWTSQLAEGEHWSHG